MDSETIKSSIVTNVYHINADKKIALHHHKNCDELFYCIQGEGFGVLENEEVSTVESEESDFTALPGISRKLMVLSGKTTLNHKDRYSILLEKFEVDSFQGDWKTISAGRCTDFNLMTSGITSGNISAIVLKGGQALNLKIKEIYNWVFIYIFAGKVSVKLENKEVSLNMGDLLILKNLVPGSFELSSLENCELVFSEIAQ